MPEIVILSVLKLVPHPLMSDLMLIIYTQSASSWVIVEAFISSALFTVILVALFTNISPITD